MLSQLLAIFSDTTWVNFLDIGLVALTLYYVYSVIDKTRALPVLHGIIIVFICAQLSSYFSLETLAYILFKFCELIFFAIIILFPTEIRKELYLLGKKFSFKKIIGIEKTKIDELIQAVQSLGKNKTGSIIAIERSVELEGLISTGISLKADINKNLISSIFQKQSPLHDGVLVIRKNQMVAAGCYVNRISDSIEQLKNKGSRHRAALGLSEQSDAIIIITSEESGSISIAKESTTFIDLTTDELSEYLNNEFLTFKENKEINDKVD